ncbi:MAG: class I SAM-dependent methyltransferase [Pusillimonas sp.]
MRTHYIGHDQVYQAYKKDGMAGWDKTEEAYAERFAWMERIFAAGNVPTAGKLLELGCGAGNMGVWLAAKGYDVAGVDIAPTAIEWANEKARTAASSARFFVGSVLELNDFADCSFDIVVDSKCFHCIIGEDRNTFLKEASRVLKKGGYLLIDSMCTPVKSDKIKGYDPATGNTVINGIITRHFATPDNLKKEVFEAGFKIVNSFVEIDEFNGNMVVESIKL